MFSQKRMKTSVTELLKVPKESKNKKNSNTSKKNSTCIKNYSRELSRGTLVSVTPQKGSHEKRLTNNRTHKNSNASKHMKSCINYDEDLYKYDKESRMVTKRKKSSKTLKIDKQIRTKTQHFNVLCRCLTQYVKQERRQGKNPNAQIFNLLKAFNSSQIKPVSKQLETLIKSMLEYLQTTIIREDKQKNSIHTQKISISEQLFSHQNSDKKKQHSAQWDKTAKKKGRKIEDQPKQFGQFIRSNAKINKYTSYEEDAENYQHQQIEESQQKQMKSKLQEQLEDDVRNISDKLRSLKKAQAKLSEEVQTRETDKQKLERIIRQQQKDLEQINNKLNSSQESDSDYQ